VVILLRLPVRLVSVGFLSVLALMISITVITPHAYGFIIIPAPTVSPNPATAGQPFMVYGTISAASVGDSITGFFYVDLSVAHSCGGTLGLISALGPVTLGSSRSYSFTITAPTSSFYPQYYCVVIIDGSSSSFPLTSISVNAAPPIPEYPYGLPLLAIFMLIGYGVIRRKTATKQK